MRRAVNLDETLLRHVRVDLRGDNRGVAEERLDDAQVGAAVEQVRGIAVSQGVRVGGGAGLGDVTLADYTGKTVLLSVVPSVDTPVCAIQTKKFNEKAASLPESVEIVTVSTDLPFAQARFCTEQGIDKLKSLSDHRDTGFGKAYGVLITEGPFTRVLSRALFVIGPDGVLKHAQYVPEVADEPDYDAALAVVA